jgi:alpha-L-fucosidase
LEFDLGKKQTFDRAMLQENIRVGQRVEAFRIQAWDAGSGRNVPKERRLATSAFFDSLS